MTNSTNKPDEQRKLTDDELDLVTGGASWQFLMEEDMNSTFLKYKDSRQFKDATFEEFLQYFYRNHTDYLQCRDAWIAAGRPQNLSFRIGDDGSIITEDFSRAENFIRR